MKFAFKQGCGIGLGLAAAMFSLSSQAYVTGEMGDGPLNVKRPVHVIVIGHPGDDGGDAFLRAGLTQAREYMKAYPDQQVLMISPSLSNGNDLYSSSARDLVRRRSNRDSLTPSVLLQALLKLKKISSLDFYGHNHFRGLDSYGFRLDASTSPQDRLTENKTQFEALKTHFEKDAHAAFWSCNSGFLLAPAYSKMWKIPVAGMLTDTDFQRLHIDDNWYFNNKDEFPAHLKVASGNPWRLMPRNKPYQGHNGNLQAGLGFPKFFCNYTEYFDRPRCERIMAIAMLTMPSAKAIDVSDYDAYKERVQDFLCPIFNPDARNAEQQIHEKSACVKALESSVQSKNAVFSSMKVEENQSILECTMKNCNFNIDSMSAPQNHSPKTQVYEYWTYLNGYDAYARKYLR